MSNEAQKQEAIARLAQQIYVGLVTQATTFVNNAPQMTAAPEGLVSLSFKLAEAHLKYEAARAAAAAPGAKGFDMSTLNFDDMMGAAEAQGAAKAAG